MIRAQIVKPCHSDNYYKFSILKKLKAYVHTAIIDNNIYQNLAKQIILKLKAVLSTYKDRHPLRTQEVGFRNVRRHTLVYESRILEDLKFLLKSQQLIILMEYSLCSFFRVFLLSCIYLWLVVENFVRLTLSLRATIC